MYILNPPLFLDVRGGVVLLIRACKDEGVEYVPYDSFALTRGSQPKTAELTSVV